ncbi:putative RNase H-like HicB family nuclease [Bradyrhizobium barranii subsp. barranii]
MPQYVAIIEDAGPDDAVSLWFPDLPGCISGGDDVDEALESAPEALAFYAQELSGRPPASPTKYVGRAQGRP